MKAFPIERLAPRPQRIELRPRGMPLAREVLVRLAEPHALEARARRFQSALGALGHTVELSASPARAARDGISEIRVGFDRSAEAHGRRAEAARAESYRLSIDEGAIEITARDAVGAGRGLQTLVQILRLAHAGTSDAPAPAPVELPGLSITDWPDFPARGVLLDISRTKVPKRATLFALVDRLADLKINQLQLYTEHTFAYAGHEIVWQGASPLSGDDILALDAYCRARDVELVPNQQSFGHMHRWLVHEPYRALAEVPEGIEHAFSRAHEPYGLCPTDPASLALLEDLYDQLLPHFTSGLFNTGLDETIDLGSGRSREVCEKRGRERVYLDFLREVEARVRARGRRMQFWGDVLVRHPDLCREIPRTAIALEWGYEADHPYAERLAVFAESGLEFYVAPGTSSWQSIAGRTQNALANLRSAAEAGVRAGARGYLVTDWGDRGHLQPLAVSLSGMLAGACYGWNARGDEIDARVLASRLDAHVFEDPAHVLGKTVCELGDAYLESRSPSTNGSALFFLLAFAAEGLPHARMPNLGLEGLARALEYVVERRVLAEEARPTAADAALLHDEVRWTADVLAFACRFGIARLRAPSAAPVAAIAGSARLQLAHELGPLIDEHRRLWLARNRPGGLDESAAWLDRIHAALRG